MGKRLGAVRACGPMNILRSEQLAEKIGHCLTLLTWSQTSSAFNDPKVLKHEMDEMLSFMYLATKNVCMSRFEFTC